MPFLDTQRNIQHGAVDGVIHKQRQITVLLGLGDLLLQVVNILLKFMKTALVLRRMPRTAFRQFPGQAVTRALAGQLYRGSRLTVGDVRLCNRSP
ncbi:hypothetical protein D3C75_1246320 [compost metagenome]